MPKTESDGERQISQAKPSLSILGLAGVAGFLVCVFTLTGFAGSWYWAFEVTSHFRIQYAAILLVLAVGFLSIKRWQSGGLFLVFGLLNGWLLLPYLRVTELHSAITGPTIKLLAWNVNSRNETFQELSLLLDRQEPDVVLLMEVSSPWGRFLESGVTNYPHRKIAARDDNFGIALLSKFPLKNAQTLYLGEAGLPSLQTRLTTEGRDIAFLGTHPLPPAGSLRSRLRDQQLNAVATWVNQQTNATIVVGDLNTTPWSPVYQEFIEATQLNNGAEGRGLHGTWPAFFKPMIIPIDHFLHSGDVVLLRREILSTKGSDHLPQIIDFTTADLLPVH